MNDKKGPPSFKYKLFIAILQLGVVVEFIRYALHSSGPLWMWMCIGGFIVSCPAGWFPREGKVRWTLGGAGVSLMLAGVVLLALHR
jgi:hypothetical protein